MHHALCMQPLHHLIGDQLVIIRGLQALCHGFKGHQEASELRVTIEPPRLVKRQGRAVALGEEHECFGSHRTLKVQVQLCLGEAANKLHRIMSHHS